MASNELSRVFGELARELRVERELSQRDLARSVETVQTKVSLLELGKLDFSALSFVGSVCEVFGIATVDLVEAALARLEDTGPRPRIDRPWAIGSSRLAEALADRGIDAAPDLLGHPPVPEVEEAVEEEGVPVVAGRLARSRAFGPVPGSDPASWMVPFAPPLVHEATATFLASDRAAGLSDAVRARIVEEAHRFSVAHELASDPAQGLAYVDRLAADHALPELEYLRGLLLHQQGESPLRVKSAIRQALDLVEQGPVVDLRADLVVAGLLSYLDVAAGSADRPGAASVDAAGRLDRALRLLDLGGFELGRVQIRLHRSIAAHGALRSSETRDEPGWRESWDETLAALGSVRDAYAALGVEMGEAYVTDWLARHHELGGDPRAALELIARTVDTYGRLGQRRWLCSAHVRAAYCRRQLAESRIRGGADGAPGDEAVALLEETRSTLGDLLAEGAVPPYELPRLEHHLAVAHGLLAGLLEARGEDGGRRRERVVDYKRWKKASLDHYDPDVEADRDDRKGARRSFRELEERYPVLGGRRRATGGGKR